MTRDELYSYLADPKRLTAETLEPIRALYESYPYCAPFAFLYLYNLSLTGDVRYASELRRLSVLLPDREQLFRLVEGNRPAFVAVTPDAPAEVDAFDLIDHFLDGARSSGEDLPEQLHYEGGGRVKTTSLERRQSLFPRRDSPSFSSHALLPQPPLCLLLQRSLPLKNSSRRPSPRSIFSSSITIRH